MTYAYPYAYTSPMIDDMPRVGIRELRDNLKDYLEQVEQGATIEITKNGRTIGMIVPKLNDNPTARLVAEGRLLPPRSGSGSIRLPQRVRPSPSSPSSDEVLDEMRTDRQ